MKNGVKQMFVVLLIMLPLTAVMGQQRGMRDMSDKGQRDGRGLEMMIPDLTEEQQTQIKQIHLNLRKEMLPIENQLQENQAKMRTLETAENPDMKAIEKLIDDSGELQAQMRKNAAANHQEVRKLLTEDQRVIFDSRNGQMRARMGREEGRAGMRGERRERFRRHHPDGAE